MNEIEEFSSWLESRRLIISQLTAMDASIRELGVRIDKYNETARERAAEFSKEAQVGISDLKLRVAMLELRAKLWGAALGMISGAIATGVFQLVGQTLHR
jgi:hypothetical protein